jgi:nucleotide-binding universal stress UspA family protein
MAGIQHVLHPTDLSVESRRAFDHARLIAERFGARLTVYHALVSEVQLYDTEAAAQARDDAAEAAVRAQLASLVQPLAAPHEIVVERNVVVPAFADVAVLSRIEQTQPDLTVMATHSRPGVGSYFVGTVTEQVVRLARRPVLAVRKGPRDAVAPYRRILVATDLSTASQAAFPWSRLLAERFSAEVIAVHVATGSPSEAERRTEELRRFVAPHHEGVSLQVVVRQGRAWKEIVSVAESREADLIVMASRGHDSLGDEVLGSNTDRVLRSAPCPVCVVR